MKRFAVVGFLLLAAGMAFAQGDAPVIGVLTASATACQPSTNTTACVFLPVNKTINTVGVSLAGTFSGTFQFEGSVDAGATWASVSAFPAASTTSVTSATGTGTWTIVSAGFSYIRVRCSTYASGSATATLNPSQAIAAGSGGGGGNGVTITTVAGLASVPGKTNGTIAVVTNGNSATDCTVGGGSNLVTCQYNGSTWSQLVASSSGGTAFSAITGSTNTTAAMICSTGCSIAVSGSGTNQSTSLTGTPSITINALTATTINGAAFSGTFSGAPTFSGNIAFTGTPTFSNTLALNTSGTSGGLTGTPSITVNALSATTINGAALSGTFTGTPTFSGNVAFSGTPTFSNTLALNTSGNAGTSTTAANLTGCTGSATGDICYYNSGWTRLAGNASGTKFLQETSAGAISWATGGSAPSLDQVTGSAAQATGTETAAGHQYTFAGVETSNLDAPFTFLQHELNKQQHKYWASRGCGRDINRRNWNACVRCFGHGRPGRFLLGRIGFKRNLHGWNQRGQHRGDWEPISGRFTDHKFCYQRLRIIQSLHRWRRRGNWADAHSY